MNTGISLERGVPGLPGTKLREAAFPVHRRGPCGVGVSFRTGWVGASPRWWAVGLVLVALLGVGLRRPAKVAAYEAGYSGAYAPFPQARRWPLRPAARGAGEDSSQETWKFPLKGRKEATIKVSRGDEALLHLEHPGGSSTWIITGFQPYPCEGWGADLNRDGISDLVLNFSGTGCGIAAEHTHTVFFLSHGGGYVPRVLASMGFGSEDVLDRGGGRPVIVHTDLIGTDAGRDRRFHHFWVHTCYRLDGTAFVRDAPRDPIWIHYTFRENHRPTDLLSPVQQQRLWQEQGRQPFPDLAPLRPQEP